MGRKSSREDREKRRDKVMTMALAGASCRQISRQLDVHHSTVARDIRARLQEAAKRDPATEAYRELHRQRIERLFRPWWPRAFEDPQAVDVVVRLLAREAKLLGLDLPPQGSTASPKPDMAALTDADVEALRALLGDGPNSKIR